MYGFEDDSRKDSEVPNWRNGFGREDRNDREGRKSKDSLGFSGN